MDYSFVHKVYDDEKFLGTAFFINRNTLYTAYHCIKDVKHCENCYILLNDTLQKYAIKNIGEVQELDLAEITLEDEVSIIQLPQISTEYVNTKKGLEAYGFKKTQQEVGVLIKLEEYEELQNEVAEFMLMVKDEEDGVRWNGVSGGPIVIDECVCGMALKNYGGDGLKTRMKIISFNKIIKHLVDTNRLDMVERLPENHLSAQLKEQMQNNKKFCIDMHYCAGYEETMGLMDVCVNFVKLDNDNLLNEQGYIKKIKDIMATYAVNLDEKYQDKSFMDQEKLMMVYKRMNEVMEKMKMDYNSAFILLWIFSEGILNIPRIGRLLVKRGSDYYEEDVYIRADDGDIAIVLPVIEVYEELLGAIKNILLSIRGRSAANEVQINRIDWDNKAIECLSHKTKVDIGSMIRGEYRDKINIEITALVVHNSEIYSNIPSCMNTDERVKQFFNDEFHTKFNGTDEYFEILGAAKSIGVKINLFVLPLLDIKKIQSI